MGWADATRPQRDHYFFVQERPGETWHCESDEDCERMLCGRVIPVDAAHSKIQYRWGPRKCPDCFLIFERRDHEERS